MFAITKERPERGVWDNEVADAPQPGVGEVRIGVAQAGICGTDYHIYAWDPWSAGRVRPPLTIGHEFAGYTDDGRAVAVEPIRGCGVCGLCRAGDYNRCPETLNNICGITRDGGMADEAMVSPDMLVPCPRGWAPEEAFATAANRAAGAIKVVLEP